MPRISVPGQSKRCERGQTLILVAVSLVAILAMAVLAIDVVTLYVARADAQRAADAAALAGAKALVDSGLTSESCGNFATTAGLATPFATQQAQVAAQQNTISGQVPPISSITVSFPNFSATCPGPFSINPQVSVQVQSTAVPTFFARIWNRGPITVSATGIAEAYNPSSATGAAVPLAPRCPKPMVFPNCDPDATHTGGPSSVCGGYHTFVDPTTGAISNPGLANATPPGVLGEVIHFSSGCNPTVPGSCAPLPPNPNPATPPPPPRPFLQYYPLQLTDFTRTCPNCGTSLSGFAQDLACCNNAPLQCTSATAPAPSIDNSVNPDGTGTAAQAGGQCRIHKLGSTYIPNCQPGGGGSNEQDCIDSIPLGTLPSNQLPFRMFAGSLNPALNSPALSVGDRITTSDSVVTIPVYDNGSGSAPSGTVPIVGFLQVFINDVDSTGQFTGTIINVAGCNANLTGNPVQGAGSMLPVRLIHP